MVNIHIHNLQGQLLSSINVGKQQKGKYTIDRNISEYPPGIYFLHLQIGSEVVIKKLVKL